VGDLWPRHENQNLPGFIVMYDTLGRGLPKGYAQNWGAGFLPGIYQGTALKAQGAPIDNLDRSPHMNEQQQRRQLDLLRRLNGRHQQERGDAELSARIESFELAYRMQLAAPEALEINGETEATRRLYGLDDRRCAHFGRQCLLARRLVERGVRFIQIYSGGEENERSWDGHTNIAANHRQFCRRDRYAHCRSVNGPEAARPARLDAGGLGRRVRPAAAGAANAQRQPVRPRPQSARLHHLDGRRRRPGGVHHGETDEVGHRAAWTACRSTTCTPPMLHLLGMDHRRLTYRFNGRNYRLTDVYGNVIRPILV